MSTIRTRELQMSPALSSEQIGIARRFSSGSRTRFAPEEIIYKVGDRHAPAWLVLAGSMEVVRRDGPPPGGPHHHPYCGSVAGRSEPRSTRFAAINSEENL